MPSGGKPGPKKLDRMAAQKLLAKAAYQRYSAELRHSCGVSQSAMACAINDMLHEFSADIQRLLGVNMFEMECYFRFFRTSASWIGQHRI